MANPIKAVKAIGRAVGGITGKGSKNVSPTYKAFPTVKIKNTKVPGVMEERLLNYTGPSMIRHMKETGYRSKAQAKANKRGLKAAQGKSLAPRGYKPDTRGRARAKEFAEPLIKSRGRKEAMRDGARALDIERTRLEFPKAPKNKRGR